MRRSDSRPYLAVLALGAFVIFLAALQLTRSVPAVELTVAYPTSTVLGQAPAALPFSSAGGSNVAVNGLGTLGSAGPTTPRPIASVTKIMMAYVILKEHPLTPGQPGPAVAMTQRDALRFNELVLNDATALPVTAGQSFTQYQLLQGALIASANNFAEYLAAWDSGTVANFVTKMNNEARALGMNSTTYTDTSGLSQGSVSTPQDQLILARAAMENAVFREIVAMPTARLPFIGQIMAVNQILGMDGVIGIKTGFTEEAGGNLVFAAERDVAGQKVEITGTVLNQATRPQAFDASRRIINAVVAGLQDTKVVFAGEVVASVKPAWGSAVDVVVGEDLSMLIWPGMTVETKVEIDPLTAPADKGQAVGVLNVTLGEQQRQVPLVLANDLPSPGFMWKLTNF